MPKSVRTAEQICDERQNCMAKIAVDAPGALHMRMPLLKGYPPDASGRNWNVVPLNDLGADSVLKNPESNRRHAYQV